MPDSGQGFHRDFNTIGLFVPVFSQDKNAGLIPVKGYVLNVGIYNFHTTQAACKHKGDNGVISGPP